MTRRRLTLGLLIFFVALSLPTSILVYQAYGQLKWEAFHQHQRLARELNLRIDARFNEFIDREENRPISDYEFLNVAGSEGAGFLQRSPLSEYPVKSELPGLLGYFQVDAAGQLSTPTVPNANASDYGISVIELEQRTKLESQIRNILDQNKLVGRTDASNLPVVAGNEVMEEKLDLPDSVSELESANLADYRADKDVSGQSVFDKLSSRTAMPASVSKAPSEQVRDLKLEDSYQVAAGAESEERRAQSKKQSQIDRSRKEKVNLPETSGVIRELSTQVMKGAADDQTVELKSVLNQQTVRIQTFESEVEPMEFALLDSGHFVLFRRLWHKNERFVQGILIEQSTFVDQLITPAFSQSSLSSISNLIVAYKGGILKRYIPDYSRQYRPGAEQASSELLYQSRLIAPFDELELIFTLARLPVGAGGQVIIWSALVLSLVLIVGVLMFYRLGIRQLALSQQQQDFVSAVSHELKTPLTSIRMYGEMLRQGWADKEKRRSYYDFIFFESERLTRLINNVLQLASMSRSEQKPNLTRMSVNEALNELRPRLTSQLEASGLDLQIEVETEAEEAHIDIDMDWFIQIFINLVDNAVKFSGGSEAKRVSISCKAMSNDKIQFLVRDYGPGIAADQMKKIFKLFYRSENELTRETVGTGIGLALVQELTAAMGAEIDVVNREPGAEFQISFPTIPN
ncbi:MAG: sensor histidine kinase [bacterium]